MKILLVVTDTEVGGVTSAAVNLSNELVSRGHNVSFLDMSGKHACAERLREGVERRCLKGRSTFWNIGGNSVKSANGIKKLGMLALGVVKKVTIRSGLWYRLVFQKFKAECFDVAIAFRQCAPCYSFVLNKVNAKKKLGFVHGELKYMGDISSWKKYMERFHKMAYVSNAVKEEFVTAYPELARNACTVYNMFDKKQIYRMAHEKNPMFFDKNVKNIVTVARIDNDFKRIDLVPELCKSLIAKTATRFHWYIVGDGPDREAVEKKIDDLQIGHLVTLCGATDNPYAILNEADFSVLTSKSESFGLVVVESFILKKPVVVAEYPAIHEIMEDGKQGIIAEQSIESLTTGIKKMIENRGGTLDICRKFFETYNYNNDIPYEQFLRSI